MKGFCETRDLTMTAPAGQPLTVSADSNGSISLDNFNAAITFEPTNGGVNLANLGGSVKGGTTNGGVNITLIGSKWESKGLDVATTDGGTRWKLPRTYSAQLFTSTDMGGINTSLPVTKSGMFHKEVTTSLGQGGARCAP